MFGFVRPIAEVGVCSCNTWVACLTQVIEQYRLLCQGRCLIASSMTKVCSDAWRYVPRNVGLAALQSSLPVGASGALQLVAADISHCKTLMAEMFVCVCLLRSAVPTHSLALSPALCLAGISAGWPVWCPAAGCSGHQPAQNTDG